jgi:hypothetical protein
MLDGARRVRGAPHGLFAAAVEGLDEDLRRFLG